MTKSKPAVLEQRSTHYRFDLEKDIPWDALQSEGAYYSDSLLENLGFDIKPLKQHQDVMEVCQWVMGLATVQTFIQLERDLISFINHHQADLSLPISAGLLVEEEKKHITLFQRFNDHLRLQRTDLVEAIDRAYRPPALFGDLIKSLTDQLSEAEIQWLFWLNTLFFEEYTVYFSQILEKESAQPAWFTAHRCHSREEIQHILTDAAYLDTIPVNVEQKRRLAIAFATNLRVDFRRFFCLETWAILQAELFPDLDILGEHKSLSSLPIVDDLIFHRLFRFTRRYVPDLTSELGGEESQRGTIMRAHPVDQSPFNAQNKDTLVSRFQAVIQGGSGEIVFYNNKNSNVSLTYAQLYQKSESFLAALQQRGLTAGNTVILALTDPIELLPAFWGCVLGGVVPVPVSPPVAVKEERAEVQKLLQIHKQVQSKLFIADPVLVESLSVLFKQKDIDSIQCFSPSDLLNSQTGVARLHQCKSDEIAFVQFSSGSMGTPKGVSLTHSNLLSVIETMLSARGGGKDDVFLSWLPLSHDMGLIGYHLTPLVAGATQVLLKTLEFIKYPTLWFQCLHDYRATVTGGTCSAISRVLKFATPEFIAGIDLSHLHTMVLGAEPVFKQVIDDLAEMFAAAGLRGEAICPAYGLAEASLAVTLSPKGKHPEARRFSVRKLEKGLASPSGQTGSIDPNETISLVNLGPPVSGTRVRITNDAGKALEEGTVGNIRVAGPGVMLGYYQDEKTTRDATQGSWLKTGDQGFLLNGHLFFVGRALEAFSIDGRKIFASDVENAALEFDRIFSDSAALLINTALDGAGHELILLVSPKASKKEQVDSVFRDLHARIRTRFGISLDKIIALKRRELTRTTSGKIARFRLLEQYKNGVFSTKNIVHFLSPRKLPVPPVDPVSGENNADSQKYREREIFWQDVATGVRNIWSDVLRCPPDKIGPDDDFLALGGDSLAAAAVLVRLEKVTGLAFSTQLLVHGTTINRTAAYMQEQEKSKDTAVPAKVVHQQSKTPLNNAIFEPGTIPGRNHKPGEVLEPIAVVAMALRFPQANTQEEFWKILIDGRDVFEKVPDSRAVDAIWNEQKINEAPGRYAGTFLSDIAHFDPEYFGILEDEAKYIDPQQRLFLEVCSTALDQVAVTSKRIGVFAAAGDNEYALRYLSDDTLLAKYSLLGGLRNMVAARVAQVFGFNGPAMAVDTACSSSATAVHLACESLRNRECDSAIAGGVQINLTNQVYLYFEKAGLLSHKGRCHPFSQDAAGLVPGEGAGVVILKRLEQALADEDTIIGLIRSSSINNDAGALSGTAPSTGGQQQVIKETYQKVKLDTNSVSYVEAHAAGTAIGDAIEVQSLNEVFAANRRRLPIGSVKSNYGHTLAAAGIVSLLKVLLSLKKSRLLPTLHCSHPAKRIDFGSTNLFPLRQSMQWPQQENRARRAGINSFGLGGTNVHILVEEVKPSRDQVLQRSTPVDERNVFCLSSTENQLPVVAKEYRKAIENTSAMLAQLCSAAENRGQFLPERHALVAGSIDELVSKLKYFEQGKGRTDAMRKSARVAFVYQGSRGDLIETVRFLFQTEQSFRRSYSSISNELLEKGIDILSPVVDREKAQGLSFNISQIIMFAFSVSATRWLQHMGVTPDAILGYDGGEYVAAYISGALSMNDSLDLVIQYAVQAPESEVNGKFADFLRGMNFSPPVITLISTAERSTIEHAEKEYWANQYLNPVNLKSAAQHAHELGVDTFIEFGDSSDLSECLQKFYATRQAGYACVPLITRVENNAVSTVDALASMINLGLPVRLARSSRSMQCQEEILPPYPFRQRRFWIEPTSKVADEKSCFKVVDRSDPGIRDHKINDISSAPFSWLIDTVFEFIRGLTQIPQEIFKITLVNPFSLHGKERRQVKIYVNETQSDPELTLSSISDQSGEEMLHLRCKFRPRRERNFKRIDIKSLETRCPAEVNVDALYESLQSCGFNMGVSMQALHSIRLGDEELLASLKTPDEARQGWLVDPSLLDGASHAAAAFLDEQQIISKSLYVGFSIDVVRIFAPVRKAVNCYLRCRPQGAETTTEKNQFVYYDIILLGEDGEVLLVAENFCARRIIPQQKTTRTAHQLPEDIIEISSPATNIRTYFDRSKNSQESTDADGPSFSGMKDRDQRIAFIKQVVARRLNVSAESIPLDLSFSQLGVDSLMAVELLREIENKISIPLPSTLLFEAENIAMLEEMLRSRMTHRSRQT